MSVGKRKSTFAVYFPDRSPLAPSDQVAGIRWTLNSVAHEEAVALAACCRVSEAVPLELDLAADAALARKADTIAVVLRVVAEAPRVLVRKRAVGIEYTLVALGQTNRPCIVPLVPLFVVYSRNVKAVLRPGTPAAVTAAAARADGCPVGVRSSVHRDAATTQTTTTATAVSALNGCDEVDMYNNNSDYRVFGPF